MTLRVLHLLDHSIPLQSGYTFRTRAILREQRRLGWETFHLTSPKHIAPSEPEEEVDGLAFHRTIWSPQGVERWPVARELALMRATARRLEEVARRVRPNLLHAHSPVLNAFSALWVGRRLRIPVVYEVRAFWEDAAVDHKTAREAGLRYTATRAAETFALRRADQVTTICEGLRQDIVARGIDDRKVTVIPNAVDPGRFEFDTPPDLALKARLGLDGKPVVGFIGSYYAYEGLDLLIDALPRMMTALPDVHVLLVGGGPQEAALARHAAARGVAGRVMFTGRMPHAEIHRYYSIVDVFAYPRRSMRLTELVTPLKPLEAMAQGKMFVASDVGGHRELIEHGVTGHLFRAGDPDALAAAIVEVFRQRDRWPEFKRRGRRFVESERNWTASVARYGDVYGRLQWAA